MRYVFVFQREPVNPWHGLCHLLTTLSFISGWRWEDQLRGVLQHRRQHRRPQEDGRRRLIQKQVGSGAAEILGAAAARWSEASVCVILQRSAVGPVALIKKTSMQQHPCSFSFTPNQPRVPYSKSFTLKIYSNLKLTYLFLRMEVSLRAAYISPDLKCPSFFRSL